MVRELSAADRFWRRARPRAALLLAAVTLLAGCGIRGPLVMPKAEPPRATPATSPTPAAPAAPTERPAPGAPTAPPAT